MRTVKECMDILELAIGEVEYSIPSDVLEDTIEYLKKYKKLATEKSWEMFPEKMGR